jgi:hypothetical protein
LSIPQSREVEAYLDSKGTAYVIEKAGIVRAKKSVKNAAGAFMKAMSDDWKAPRSIEPPKRMKPTRPNPVPIDEPQRRALRNQKKGINGPKRKVEELACDR